MHQLIYINIYIIHNIGYRLSLLHFLIQLLYSAFTKYNNYCDKITLYIFIK